jgi:hypothetical protein
VAGNVLLTKSDPAVDFTEALTPGGSTDADLTFPMAIGAGGHSRCRIRHLAILSKDNCAWEVIFYGKQTRATGDPTTDTFRSRFRFSASDAILRNGLWYYYVPDVDMPYEDETQLGKCYVTLINRSPATSKSAGAAGALMLRLYVEVTYGWG